MSENNHDAGTRLLLRTLLPVYGIIVVLVIGAIWYADRENDQQNADREEVIDRFLEGQISDCEDQNDANEILKQAIDISTAQGGGATFDLTSIEGYDELDPAMKTWVNGFNDLIAQSGGGGSVTDELKKFAETTLQPVDCEQIRTDFEKARAEA